MAINKLNSLKMNEPTETFNSNICIYGVIKLIYLLFVTF